MSLKHQPEQSLNYDNVVQMLALNESAVDFYHVASKKVKNSQLRSNYMGLRNLHTRIIHTIETKAKFTPDTMDVLTAQKKSDNCFFEILKSNLTAFPSELFIERVKKAERKWLVDFENLLSKANLLTNAKSALNIQVLQLKECHARMDPNGLGVSAIIKS